MNCRLPRSVGIIAEKEGDCNGENPQNCPFFAPKRPPSASAALAVSATLGLVWAGKKRKDS